ncbi:MAG TPA: DUF87 domain-containing protein [Thermoplasmata archaeon]|nr:DUF87 domain-containing protein [Thermoplasmata archaeon]
MTASSTETPDGVRGPRGAVLPLLLTRLPPRVAFGFLGPLLGGTAERGLRIEIQPEPPAPGLRRLEEVAGAAEAELSGTVPPPPGRRAELEREARSATELGRSVAAREQRLFRVGLCFLARGRTGPEAERRRTELERSLGALGFRTRSPVYECAPALSPRRGDASERRPVGYWHLLPSDSVAAFLPFVDEAMLEPGGVLVGLALEDAAPVLLDRWRHGSHSWGIFGMTGSGKSFAAALLALRERWQNPGLSVAILDPMGEFGPWAEALGGEVLRLGPGGRGHLNPLDPGAGGDPTEKAARAGALLQALFPSLRDEEVALLDRSLLTLYARGRVPVFRDLLGEVERNSEAAPRLSGLLEIFRTGSLQYLDGPTTVELQGEPLVVDLTGVAPEQRAFHLAYALDAIAERLARREGPKLLLVDEAHLLVGHPATARFLDGLVRRVRHYRAGLVLLSQSPDDFLRSEAGRSTLRNLRATLLLRLNPVSAEARRFFALSAAEAEWLARARLPREAGYSEGLLRFGPVHRPLALVASTPEFEFLRGKLAGPVDGEGAPRDAGLSPSRTGPPGDGDSLAG